jgi:hypothetical protein
VAAARTIPVRGQPISGPALAGHDVVWAERRGPVPTGRIVVRIASLDGHAQTVWSSAGDAATCRYLFELSGSASHVAFLYREATAGGQECLPDASLRLVVVKHDGTVEAASSAPQSQGANCVPISADLDGDRLAVANLNCPQSDITIEDPPSGEVLQRVPYRPEVVGSPPRADYVHSKLQLSGRYVAFKTQDFARHNAVVYDLQSGTEALRLPLAPYEGQGQIINNEVRLSLDPDGTMLVAVQDADSPASPSTLVLAKPGDSSADVLPVQGPLLDPYRDHDVVLAKRLVALRRARPLEFAVVDVAGRTVQVVDRYRPITKGAPIPAPWVGGIDFDGHRLVWIDAGVHVSRSRPAAGG